MKLYEVIIIVTSILTQAFFAGSETAFVYTPFSQATGMVLWWKRNMNRLLATTLVGTNISVVLTSSFCAVIFERNFHQWGALLSVAFVSIVSLILCEIIPKSWALRDAVRLSAIIAYPMRFFSYLFFPLVVAIEFMSKPFAKFFELYFPEKEELTFDELLHFARTTETEISTEKKIILSHIMHLESTPLYDLMTSVAHVGIIKLDDNIELIRQTMNRSKRNVIFVGDEAGNAIGYIGRQDINMLNENIGIKASMHKEPVFPMTMTGGQAISQLSKLSLDKRHLSNTSALITNETGEIVGIITLNALYRELIKNHPDSEIIDTRNYPSLITSYEFQAQTTIREVEEKLGIDLPSSRHYQSIGGFMIESLETIPKPGEYVEYKGWRFMVAASTSRKIGTVWAKRINRF